MPLSEDENRILNQIEQRLYAEDPASAERISATTLPRYLARNCGWAALGFVAGLVVLLVGFTTSWVLGLLGFVIMVGSAVVFVQNLRMMGRHGLRRLSTSLQERSWSTLAGDTGRRLRRRFGDGRDERD